MTSLTLTSLVDELASLEWTELASAHAEAQRILAGVADPAALLAPLTLRQPALVERDGSAEKTTHWKFFVGADDAQRFEVWLNAYKPRTQRRTGHAQVAHNHRFWFTSLVLRGGFTNAVLEPAPDGPVVKATRVLRAGDTFVVDPEEIHALSDIADGTLTLIVQSPPVRTYSEVYEDGTVKRFYDLPSEFERVLAELADLSPFGSDRTHR